jgi:Transmembrane secretion effector
VACLRRDFWLFWSGLTVSELGTAFTLFALPLLVFELTGSALNLAIATAASFLPYLAFGLVIGAWVDRFDRRRVLIAADVVRAVLIASIPVLSELGLLRVWWIYLVGFAGTTVTIAFDAARFAVVPRLVAGSDLVAANGRLSAGAHAAHVAGPLLAGALLASGLPTAEILYADAASFVVSGVAVASIATALHDRARPVHTRLRRAIVEGAGFVFRHPVLRNLALLGALSNFFGATLWTQLVLFAKERLDAADAEIAVFWSAGAAGALALALGSAFIRRRVGFSGAVLGATAVSGIATVALAISPWLWPAIALWGLTIGVGQFVSINTTSLRQAITPPELLGRVSTVGQVLSWSAIPVGALVGGWAIEATGSVAGVYAAIGILKLALAAGFSFTTLRRVA